MARPFESTIQDIVYNVDVGIGLRLIRLGLYILILLSIIVLYTATQFRGLKDAEAMDLAQLGRNLMMKGRFVTQNIRPASIWYLIEHSRAANPQLMDHPDIVHPPLYPAVLAAGFKVFENAFTQTRPARVFPPEQWVIVPIGHLFSALTGLLVFLIARHLFDQRVAALSLTVYFLSDAVWGMSISGTAVPMATFFLMASWYTAVLTGTRYEAGGRPFAATIGAFLAGLFCGAAFLTRYGTAAVAPAVALYLMVALRPISLRAVSAFLLAFAFVATPWIARNIAVSGGPLGLAPWLALNGADPLADNLFERTLAQDIKIANVLGTLRSKLMLGLSDLYSNHLRRLGDGVMTGIFFTTFFFSFARAPVRHLRWCVAAGIALLLPVAALYGHPTYRLLHVFLPFVVIYSVAFFYILLDRLQLRIPLLRMSVISAFVALCALPLIFRLLPPRTGLPYPPYYPPYIVHVSNMLRPDELMCTDMPWATAWYGSRNSILLPGTLDEFYDIHDYMRRISGLYFTTITRDREYIRTLVSGPYRTWFPILEGRIPSDFPLTQGFPLGNLDQLFLTDRKRW